MNDTNTAPSETLVVKYGDKWSVDIDKLPPKAIAYLLQNGFSQSMTDAAAFTKEQKAGKSEAEVATMAIEARQKRFDAILAGTVGARVGGPKLPQIDRVMRDIAEERVKALATSRNVPMPKGDVLKAAIEKVLARFGDAIKVEAQTRIDNATAAAGELDDLFAPAQPAA